jgi:radical SAM protein with 4Fe4S-binding SPASM domain
MSTERFRHVLSQIAGKTKEVVLHLLGEPLTHPELGLLIAEAALAQVPVNIVTNGTLLVGAKADAVLSPVVRQISISLQSVGDNFPDQDPTAYLRRIKAFVDRAEAERPDLYINLRFWDLDGEEALETSHNQKSRELLASTFGFSWDDVRLNIKRRKNHKIRSRLYLHFDSRFTWPDPAGERVNEAGTCYGLKGHFGIHSDGTVVPCCLDSNAHIALGNIFSDDVDDILAGERATRMRRGFERGELVEDLCKTCGYIKRFSRKKNHQKSERAP